MRGRGRLRVRGRGACTVGACMAGDVARGECMAGIMHGWGDVAGGGMRGTHTPPGRHYEIWSMSRQYASYWNAFLFRVILCLLCKKYSSNDQLTFIGRSGSNHSVFWLCRVNKLGLSCIPLLYTCVSTKRV